MSLKHIPVGNDAPHDINVLIEIPRNGEAVKYEVDKDSGMIMVDRVLNTAFRYPCNYGFVPHTLCGDGDPVDVCVIMPIPLLPGSIIKCRPVGVLKMTDEGGEDAKIIAVPVSDVSGLYRHVADVRDINTETLDKIAHFFEHYKDLEQGKWVKTEGWGGVEEAKQEIRDSIKNFEEAEDKPNF
ncbi:MAG: inorganic diphosphatase [Marinicella sp.]